ncbi:hypothetical protein [Enterococcus cecorum]|uniref:hypothetical protein n=1 Tax=Enterococcus cecorum TaxID=44008 RepID=UPI001FAE4D37|nr:hypothetical protein [Enterococcus cecorum]MCJ0567136.1 hypothetical protein [Enterococcus cecorum]MCJ0597205.1 hypothetical protein [Enterococcus cecorum]
MQKQGYLIKKTVYIDKSGRTYDYPSSYAEYFDSREEAEVKARMHMGQVIDIRDFSKKSRRNQGWMRR